MRLFRFVQPILIVCISTLITIIAANMLCAGLFALTSVVAVFALTVGLSIGAFALLAVITLAVCVPLRIESPGFLLHTVFGVIAGTVCYGIGELVFPSIIVGTVFGAAAFALVNTLIIWAIAVPTKNVPSPLKFLPEFEKR